MPYDWQRKGERGFFCEGENERGVPVLTGTWDLPPLGFCLLFLLLGGVGMSFAVWNGALCLLYGESHLVASLLLLLWGGIYFANGAHLYRLRGQILRLASEEHLCQQLGLDGAAFQRAVQERDIRPRYDINGRAFYDPADFGDPALLLRPAAMAPTPPDRLLRRAERPGRAGARALVRMANPSIESGRDRDPRGADR